MRFFSLFTVLILCSALHLSVAKNLAVDDESTGTLIQVEDVKQTVSSSVDFAIGSSFVPSYVRQALATGKVVYEKFLKDAGESPDESNDALNSVANTTKTGTRFSIDNVKNLIAAGLDHALESPLISQSTKKALTAGRTVFQKFLRNSTSDSDEDAPRLTKEDMKTVVNGGVDFAMTSPVVPLTAKGVIAAGKALQKGFEKYDETRNLGEAKKAAMDTCVESAEDIVQSLPGIGLVKTGTSLAKDLLYDGKDVPSAILNRSKEALSRVCSSIANVATNTIFGRGKTELNSSPTIEVSEIDTKNSA